MKWNKTWLKIKLKQNATEFMVKQNKLDNKRSREMMNAMVSAAAQISNNIGFAAEYPIKIDNKTSFCNTFVELMGFYLESDSLIRNAEYRIVQKLKIYYLMNLDIEGDNQYFRKEWLRHDEYIYLYFEKKLD
jgi:hypothetical protein